MESHRSHNSVIKTVTFAELCLDFLLATHVSLAAPGRDDATASLQSRSRTFAAASRHMSKICKCSLVFDTSRFAEHVPSLSVLGLGRHAGIQFRPMFLCARALRDVLFTTALKCQGSRTFSVIRDLSGGPHAI